MSLFEELHNIHLHILSDVFLNEIFFNACSNDKIKEKTKIIKNSEVINF